MMFDIKISPYTLMHVYIYVYIYIYMHLHIDICVEHQLDSVGNAKGEGFDHRIWTLLLDT